MPQTQHVEQKKALALAAAFAQMDAETIPSMQHAKEVLQEAVLGIAAKAREPSQAFRARRRSSNVNEMLSGLPASQYTRFSRMLDTTLRAVEAITFELDETYHETAVKSAVMRLRELEDGLKRMPTTKASPRTPPIFDILMSAFDAQVSAAVVIQRAWRAHRQRRAARQLVEQERQSLRRGSNLEEIAPRYLEGVTMPVQEHPRGLGSLGAQSMTAAAPAAPAAKSKAGGRPIKGKPRTNKGVAQLDRAHSLAQHLFEMEAAARGATDTLAGPVSGTDQEEEEEDEDDEDEGDDEHRTSAPKSRPQKEGGDDQPLQAGGQLISGSGAGDTQCPLPTLNFAPTPALAAGPKEPSRSPTPVKFEDLSPMEKARRAMHAMLAGVPIQAKPPASKAASSRGGKSTGKGKQRRAKSRRHTSSDDSSSEAFSTDNSDLDAESGSGNGQDGNKGAAAAAPRNHALSSLLFAGELGLVGDMAAASDSSGADGIAAVIRAKVASLVAEIPPESVGVVVEELPQMLAIRELVEQAAEAAAVAGETRAAIVATLEQEVARIIEETAVVAVSPTKEREPRDRGAWRREQLEWWGGEVAAAEEAAAAAEAEIRAARIAAGEEVSEEYDEDNAPCSGGEEGEDEAGEGEAEDGERMSADHSGARTSNTGAQTGQQGQGAGSKASAALWASSGKPLRDRRARSPGGYMQLTAAQLAHLAAKRKEGEGDGKPRWGGGPKLTKPQAKQKAHHAAPVDAAVLARLMAGLPSVTQPTGEQGAVSSGAASPAAGVAPRPNPMKHLRHTHGGLTPSYGSTGSGSPAPSKSAGGATPAPKDSPATGGTWVLDFNGLAVYHAASSSGQGSDGGSGTASGSPAWRGGNRAGVPLGRSHMGDMQLAGQSAGGAPSMGGMKADGLGIQGCVAATGSSSGPTAAGRGIGGKGIGPINPPSGNISSGSPAALSACTSEGRLSYGPAPKQWPGPDPTQLAAALASAGPLPMMGGGGGVEGLRAFATSAPSPVPPSGLGGVQAALRPKGGLAGGPGGTRRSVDLGILAAARGSAGPRVIGASAAAMKAGDAEDDGLLAQFTLVGGSAPGKLGPGKGEEGEDGQRDVVTMLFVEEGLGTGDGGGLLPRIGPPTVPHAGGVGAVPKRMAPMPSVPSSQRVWTSTLRKDAGLGLGLMGGSLGGGLNSGVSKSVAGAQQSGGGGSAPVAPATGAGRSASPAPGSRWRQPSPVHSMAPNTAAATPPLQPPQQLQLQASPHAKSPPPTAQQLQSVQSHNGQEGITPADVPSAFHHLRPPTAESSFQPSPRTSANGGPLPRPASRDTAGLQPHAPHHRHRHIAHSSSVPVPEQLTPAPPLAHAHPHPRSAAPHTHAHTPATVPAAGQVAPAGAAAAAAAAVGPQASGVVAAPAAPAAAGSSDLGWYKPGAIRAAAANKGLRLPKIK